LSQFLTNFVFTITTEEEEDDTTTVAVVCHVINTIVKLNASQKIYFVDDDAESSPTWLLGFVSLQFSVSIHNINISLLVR
jgi:hypothetical protein